MIPTDDIKDDPLYGSILSLWIYSVGSNQWIQVADPTYQRDVHFSVDSPSFLKAIQWLNIGAMLFPQDYDPNKEKLLCPICLPESFLIQHGVKQDNLREAIRNGTQAVIQVSVDSRNVSHEATLARKEQSINKLKSQAEDVKPKVLTTQDVINMMMDGWVDLNVITKPRLSIIQKKYNVIVEGDQAKIQM